jgi:hypothetical protein
MTRMRQGRRGRRERARKGGLYEKRGGVEGGEKQNERAKERGLGQTAYKDARSPAQAQNASESQRPQAYSRTVQIYSKKHPRQHTRVTRAI